MNEKIFRQIVSENHSYYILDVIQIRDLQEANHKYRKNKTDDTRIALCSALNQYLTWFLDYTKAIFNGKCYSIDTLARIVFPKKEMMSEKVFKDYIHKSLYLEMEYVEYLIDKITPATIERYEHTILDLEVDIEWLICSHEQLIEKTDKIIQRTCWGCKVLSVSDIFSAARELFYIEEIPDVKNIYLRDLKPNVMFQIRQILEKLGNSLIGFYGIEDGNGNKIKKFTQSSWAFLGKYNGKKHWRIEFPMQLDTILALHNWSNQFVHTSYIYSNYIQFFALKVVGELLRPPKEGIVDYSGAKRHQIQDYGDVKIYEYNNLRTDFKEYIIQMMTPHQHCCSKFLESV